MDLTEALPGIVGTLVSAGSLALLAWVYPGTRWARRLKRDIDILGGLPPGDERTEWQRRVDVLARHLRLYEEYVPRWQKITPFAMAIVWGVLVAIFVVDETNRNALIAETPAFIIGIGNFLLTIVYVANAMAGTDLGGRSPESLAKKGRRSPEASL